MIGILKYCIYLNIFKGYKKMRVWNTFYDKIEELRNFSKMSKNEIFNWPPQINRIR